MYGTGPTGGTALRRALLITAGLAIGISEGWGQPTRLIPFDLRDQFNRRYTEQTFQGTPIAIVGCDRGGSAFGRAWEEALAATIRARRWRVGPRVVSVADLRSVPRVLRGFVRGKFPATPSDWSLLDWDGEFARAFAFVNDQCNILLFDDSGQLVGREKGRAPAIDHVVALVNHLDAAVHAAAGRNR